MTDSVYIEELSVLTLIGVYEFERHQKQALLLDIRVDFDCSKAGRSDDVEHALDYDRLTRTIRQWSEQQTFQLIETYGERLCQLIFETFDVNDIELKINKPAAIEGCKAVGIVIKRHR